jgi:arabinose-5-phosphate isomerase
LHAAEGIHGDLGMIDKGDVVIAVSNSGNTQELISIIPYLKFSQIPIIALTGEVDSQLAQNSEVVLNCNVPKEYEPLGLVPLLPPPWPGRGDALAIALLRQKISS